MANDEDWASDDNAGDLLSGVLHETEDEAKEEIEQVEQELQQRREEEERRRREEQERRRAEAEARITAEEERLDELEQRRTERLQAIERERMREKGIEPEPQEPEEPEEPQEPQQDQRPDTQPDAAAPGAQQRKDTPGGDRDTLEAERPEQLDQQGSSVAGWAIAAVVLLLASGGAVGGYMYLNQGYQADDTPYSKAVYEPAEPKIHMVEASATMIASEDSSEEESSEPAHRPNPRPTTTHEPSGGGSDDQGSAQEEEDEDLDIDLEGTDPFGSDDM